MRSFESKQAGTTGEIVYTGREHVNSVIKTQFVDEEYAGWQKIKDYLSVLPTKRIDIDGRPSLIVRYCPSETVNDLTNQNDKKAVESFDAFFGDLVSMWEKTAIPFESEKLIRNYAEIALRVMPKFRQAAEERLGVSGAIPIVTGGVDIGSLDEFFDIQERGFAIEPPQLVLSHGDENLGNILVPKDPESGAYKVIDARFAGYYDLAWVLGNIFARTYLFNADFPGVIGSPNVEDEKAEFASALPRQTETTEAIKQRVLDYLKEHEEDDPTLKLRTAAYVANNIGRSIAFLRDKSFTTVCEEYGVQHLLTAMYEAKQILG